MEDFQDSEGRFPPTKYVGYLDMLLVEDATKWSEKDPDARRLLKFDSQSLVYYGSCSSSNLSKRLPFRVRC